MINISHPRVHKKPPIRKSVTPKQQEVAKEAIVCVEQMWNDAIPMAEMEKADYNQNIIDSTTCSFEQICNMINDMETTIGREIPEVQVGELEPEKDKSGGKQGSSETTYDDIMSFLAKLEEGSLDETTVNVPEVDNAMLQEIFGDTQPLSLVNCDSIGTAKIENHAPLAFREDLATARLQIEEKDAAIALLKDQLKSERRLACEKLEAQRKSNASKLQTQEDKYRGVVKRHQTFIEQLIAEKTDLTEKCNSLAQRVKEIEIKVQRDLKTAADRHLVELQRAREHYAAAEKIKRERWIEARTTKIKEMTVKGLEPELRNMMEQHAEEIQRLRNLHMKELQDVELRVIRRSTEQLEQLRLELTASHERMLVNEKNIVWARYKEKLEEQENQYKEQQIKLVEEMRSDREMFSREQTKRDAEREATLQQTHLQHQQESEALKQRHSSELKTLQVSLKTEWEAWLADYKSQQNLKVERAEKRIRDECSRERDRQIELAIQRLEKDSRDAKQILQQTFDCKLRSLREKYKLDLQTAVDNEHIHKAKFMQAKEKLDKTEAQLQKAESQLKGCLSDLKNANEAVKQLSVEKDEAKRLARQDIEAEKRELEDKIASLYQEITRNNANRDASMAQLHSRIKFIMTQKVLTINNLMRERNDVKSKCEHLEKLLDQQRKEYILKSL